MCVCFCTHEHEKVLVSVQNTHLVTIILCVVFRDIFVCRCISCLFCKALASLGGDVVHVLCEVRGQQLVCLCVYADIWLDKGYMHKQCCVVQILCKVRNQQLV